jgi:hypothetical protein
MKKKYFSAFWIILFSFFAFTYAEANPIPLNEPYVSMETEDMEITISDNLNVEMKGIYGFHLGYYADESFEYYEYTDQDMVQLSGTVRYVDLEGGFYGIIGSDGKNYEPANLRSEFQQDGKSVIFSADILEDTASIYMWGTPVKVRVLHDNSVLQWNCTMKFPAPVDSTGIKVYKDDIELQWEWAEEKYTTTIDDLIDNASQQLQEWPMFEWDVDVFGSMDGYDGVDNFGASFDITVMYKHSLVKANDEWIFLYSLGTGRYNPGWNPPMPGIGDSGKPFVNVNIKVAYPSSILPKEISPDENNETYSPSITLEPEISWSAYEIQPQNDFIVTFRERCYLTTIKPESAMAGVFLPRLRVVTITGENSNFDSISKLTFNGSEGNAIRTLYSYAPDPNTLMALVVVSAGSDPGDYEASVTTGDEVCTGISLNIK